jgi:hypothetical protein
VSINEKKYNGYTKSMCPMKLSTSGKISDATVRLGASIAAKSFEIPTDAPVKMYEACVGCAGWFRAFREIRPMAQLVGIDVSPDIVKYAAELVPDGVLLSGASTPTPFLPDNFFDMTVVGFCFNNIIWHALQPIASEPEANILKAICPFVHDLYRVTKPGGGVFLPQYYEKDIGNYNDRPMLPLHFISKCLPELDLTKEGERPACNVHARGGVVYSFEENLYAAANYKDGYYKGKMKTVMVYKPTDGDVPAVPPCLIHENAGALLYLR